MMGAPDSSSLPPSAAAAAAAATPPCRPPPAGGLWQRSWMLLWNAVLVPLILFPLFVVHYALATLLGVCAALLVAPSYLLAQRLYWACPFVPHIWRRYGLFLGEFTVLFAE